MARTSGRLGHVMQTNDPADALLRDTIASALPTSLLLTAVGSVLSWTPPLGNPDLPLPTRPVPTSRSAPPAPPDP
ncbi:hypothetical protein Ssi02_46670 [Sinosporangium siamense]|uniref:Uncharacterized protein n=1 Tax=Sinosporangium siamense TaxID=1367973 RepID=A0A919RLP9_9ACTN|nr:hypothetical protein Ssi02_46670 [Sinosporangium siamense]